MGISAAPGTTIVLPPKMPPHNKKEMDQEKARLIKQLGASGSKVFFLGSRETFPDRNGDPPPCYVCKGRFAHLSNMLIVSFICTEPVKAPQVMGMLALERTLFSGFNAFAVSLGRVLTMLTSATRKRYVFVFFIGIRLTRSAISYRIVY